jgi:thiamine-phosphate pyrophosphorylase
MPLRQTIPAELPRLWLLSDARNDLRLEAALRRLPRGSGFIFRHYHLQAEQRRARFVTLARLAAQRGHLVILAGEPRTARAWGAQGSYGPATGRGGLRLATAHTLRELAAAHRSGAGAILLSPVFPTRSHPGSATLGAVRFRLLEARSRVPVLALGGMTPRTARRLDWLRWAAIDGLP